MWAWACKLPPLVAPVSTSWSLAVEALESVESLATWSVMSGKGQRSNKAKGVAWAWINLLPPAVSSAAWTGILSLLARLPLFSTPLDDFEAAAV